MCTGELSRMHFSKGSNLTYFLLPFLLQLKMKLQQIENSFSEREMKIMSNNLRQEYERQLVNIRQLRQLYEERQRVAAAEYENLQRLISIKKDELLAEQDK